MNKRGVIFILLLLNNVIQGMDKLLLPLAALKLSPDVEQLLYPFHSAIYSLTQLKLLVRKKDTKLIINAAHAELPEHPTALHQAARLGMYCAVELLLGHGADTEVRLVPSGMTPLNLLMNNLHAREREETTAEFLLDSGADVNTIDCNGDTPLHAACRAGAANMVALLLRFGAVEKRNKIGKLPHEYVFGNQRIQSLFRTQVKRSTTIKIPPRLGSADRIRPDTIIDFEGEDQ